MRTIYKFDNKKLAFSKVPKLKWTLRKEEKIKRKYNPKEISTVKAKFKGGLLKRGWNKISRRQMIRGPPPIFVREAIFG